MAEVYYSIARGIDVRASNALAKLSVFVDRPEVCYGKPLRFRLPFHFAGDRELAKYHVQNFIEDEFNGTHVLFYASCRNPSNCYAVFTIRGEEPINAQEVEANNRRSDRERKASRDSAWE